MKNRKRLLTESEFIGLLTAFARYYQSFHAAPNGTRRESRIEDYYLTQEQRARDLLVDSYKRAYDQATKNSAAP